MNTTVHKQKRSLKSDHQLIILEMRKIRKFLNCLLAIKCIINCINIVDIHHTFFYILSICNLKVTNQANIIVQINICILYLKIYILNIYFLMVGEINRKYDKIHRKKYLLILFQRFKNLL